MSDYDPGYSDTNQPPDQFAWNYPANQFNTYPALAAQVMPSATLAVAVDDTPSVGTQEVWTTTDSSMLPVVLFGTDYFQAVATASVEEFPETVLVVATLGNNTLLVQRGFGGSQVKQHSVGDQLIMITDLLNLSPFTPPTAPTYVPSPPASLSEYVYVSQYSTPNLVVGINLSGTATNVDGNAMVVTMSYVPPPGTVATGSTVVFAARAATNIAAGQYQIPIFPVDTSDPGYYALQWDFTLAGVAQTVYTYIQVGAASPAYDSLPLDMQQMVEDVFLKFSDGFDSAEGGPNIQMWFQSHFGRGRIAQLLRQTVQHLNVMAQPSGNYTVDGINGPKISLQQWSGLVNTALTVEVIKHLMRAYTEDPDIVNATGTRESRRDYQSRWQTMLSIEQADLEPQFEVWKLSLAFQGQPSVLVAGGVFPTFYYNRFVGNVARPAMWMFGY